MNTTDPMITGPARGSADTLGLSEAEIQVLASLEKARMEATASDRLALENSGRRYCRFLEDWSGAFPGLIEKGLIEGDENGYHATGPGHRLAHAYHRQRPDQYWYYYQRFYQAACASAAHTRLCERVFGADLCQEGMVDMAALDDLLARLSLNAGHHVLDVGCGAGFIAEYISDTTGARVTGLDYSAPAIALASERTMDRRSRLSFLHGDMNELELPEQTFDAAISLDSLYWVADLRDTLSQVVRTIRPGGQMGIFMLQSLEDGDPPDVLRAENTDLSRTLSALGLSCATSDYTARNAAFWQRMWEVATELRGDFELEGNDFIATSLINEAQEEFLPAIRAGTVTRYLYHVRV